MGYDAVHILMIIAADEFSSVCKILENNFITGSTWITSLLAMSKWAFPAIPRGNIYLITML